MNIRFKEIKIENFLSIGKITVNLDEQGFVIVQGINNESDIPQSNGSGKSSIFDAILWAITGETLRGASEVTNKRVSEGTLCDLYFDIDNINYRILRSKSHSHYGNSVYFYQEDCLLSDMTKKSQELINNTMSAADSQILGSIVLLGQGLPYRFSSLPPSKRKELLETISGSSSQIDKLKSSLDLEESKYQIELSDIEKSVFTSEGVINGLNQSLEYLRSQLSSRKNTDLVKEEIQHHEENIIENTKLIENLQESQLEINSQYQTFVDAQNNTYKFLLQKSQEKASKEAEYNNLLSHKECPTCHRPFEVTDDFISHQEQLYLSIQELSQTISILDGKNKSLLLQINDINDKLTSVNGEISSLKWKIESDKNTIKSLSESLIQSNNLESEIIDVETKIKEENQGITRNKDKIINLKEIISCISYLKREVSRGFKGYILEDTIKYLSQRSEYYSDYLFSSDSDKIKVSLSGNKISIDLNDKAYENLSGGERQRVDLAIQFALRDLLMTTSGFSCNVLILDEAFDNLDSQGSEALIRLITSEFSDIESVYIVTHHSEIDIPYDKTLLVIKNKEGVSSLSEGV